jgi:ABC-2 type transport system permease protein
MSNMVKPGQLMLLFSAHSKELLREPGVLFWGIIFPILMSLGLGIAFTKKADVIINIAVVEEKYNNIVTSNIPVIDSLLKKHG